MVFAAADSGWRHSAASYHAHSICDPIHNGGTMKVSRGESQERESGYNAGLRNDDRLINTQTDPNQASER